MTSIPTSISVGSVSSTISDVLHSYRRVQYIIAESPFVPSNDVLDTDSNVEDEESIQVPNDANAVTEYNHDTSFPNDSFVSQLSWDEEVDSASSTREQSPLPPKSFSSRHRSPTKPVKSGQRRESAPLLRALSSPEAQSTASHQTRRSYRSIIGPERQRSAVSLRSARQFRGGQSTFGQSLFNTTAILLGIGVLSEPLAFAYTGWIAGTALLIFYALTSCYTAKILAQFIFSDPRLRTYADIARMAFGPRSHIVISLLFCLELFAVTVLLVTIYGDSLHAIFPQYPSNTYKAVGAVILIPTVFMPLSLLSYTSILGILSSIMLVAVVFIDGLSKREAPGSLWNPVETSLFIQSPEKLAVAFGLFMAGFAGHAVIPSLARDMADPSQFDKMINWAFAIATSIYAAIGYAGYLMYGNDVSDEISKNLLLTKGYNPILNEAVLWVLVINPISKFALNMQPLHATIEIILGYGGSTEGKSKMKGNHPSFGSSFGRILLTISAVAVSIVFPQFSTVMAFMGSFSAFIINVVGPAAAKMAVQGRCNILDGTIMLIGLVMTIWGTFAAFVSY
ncbi:hypothetical protein APHAL10511_006247 [Amanita phalloides]|nr:hypothetical protein APHAL10511_006247 [Amanita phalloides]